MNKEELYILTVKEELRKTDWTFEKKDILRKAVNELRSKGYSKPEITRLFEVVALKEQDNSVMMANNARYLNYWMKF